jgi:multidrug efflux pump
MLSQQNSNVPKGQIWDDGTTADILANDQLLKADYYKPLIVGYHNGAAIKLSDIADVQDSVENIRAAGFFDGEAVHHHADLPPAQRQHHRYHVERIRQALPSLIASIPAGMEVEVMFDRRGRFFPPCGMPSVLCLFPSAW